MSSEAATAKEPQKNENVTDIHKEIHADRKGAESAHDPAISKRDRISKLESLKCWVEVQNLLETGAPVKDIAYFIRVERKEYLDAQHETLVNILYRWLHKHKKRVADSRVPVQHLALINSMTERVDPLDAANMIFAIQVDRVMMGYTKEVETKKTQKDTRENIKLAKDIIETINEIAADRVRYRLNAGAGATDPKSVRDTIEQMDRVRNAFEAQYGKTAAAVAMNPESRRKVLQALLRVQKLNSENVAQMLKESKETLAELGLGKSSVEEGLRDPEAEVAQ